MTETPMKIWQVGGSGEGEGVGLSVEEEWESGMAEPFS